MAEIGTDIAKAKALLDAGELVAVPTETVYGLAGNALVEETVMRIFEAKNRPSFDPLIIHVHDKSEISKYVLDIDPKLILLIEKFTPGPITFLLPRNELIPDIVTSGLDRVAIRVPDHPYLQKLLKSLNYPLAAPSANPFGYISPTTAEHVNQQLGDKIEYILDGGTCDIGIESTIVGMVENQVIIYRKGGLAIDLIEDIVGKVVILEHSSSNPSAPGMLKSHYAPKTPTYLFNELPAGISLKKESYGSLRFSTPHPEISEVNQIVLSKTGDMKEAAHNLFSSLRLLDSMNLSAIYLELVPEEGLGRAINDRLKRAATL